MVDLYGNFVPGADRHRDTWRGSLGIVFERQVIEVVGAPGVIRTPGTQFRNPFEL
jgi:hypothetical protein